MVNRIDEEPPQWFINTCRVICVSFLIGVGLGSLSLFLTSLNEFLKPGTDVLPLVTMMAVGVYAFCHAFRQLFIKHRPSVIRVYPPIEPIDEYEDDTYGRDCRCHVHQSRCKN